MEMDRFLPTGTIWVILILLVIGRKKAMTLTGLGAAVFYGLPYGAKF